VNVIGHSMGGLDARYMISKLDGGEFVVCTDGYGGRPIILTIPIHNQQHHIVESDDNRYTTSR